VSKPFGIFSNPQRLFGKKMWPTYALKNRIYNINISLFMSSTVIVLHDRDLQSLCFMIMLYSQCASWSCFTVNVLHDRSLQSVCFMIVLYSYFAKIVNKTNTWDSWTRILRIKVLAIVTVKDAKCLELRVPNWSINFDLKKTMKTISSCSCCSCCSNSCCKK